MRMTLTIRKDEALLIALERLNATNIASMIGKEQFAE